MHVYLIRHGETYLGAQRIHQSPNTPLSPRGKEKVETIAEEMRRVNADLLLSSGYTRAIETARIIAQRVGLSARPNELFYEIVRPSSLYHKPLRSFATVRFVVSSFLRRKNPSWRYEDAENYAGICERARRAREYLEALATDHRSVIVVSHVVFIKILLSLLCRDTIPSTIGMIKIFFGCMQLPHSGIVHLVYEPAAPGTKTCAWRIVNDT